MPQVGTGVQRWRPRRRSWRLSRAGRPGHVNIVEDMNFEICIFTAEVPEVDAAADTLGTAAAAGRLGTGRAADGALSGPHSLP